MASDGDDDNLDYVLAFVVSVQHSTKSQINFINVLAGCGVTQLREFFF